MTGDRAVGLISSIGLVVFGAITLWDAGYAKGYKNATVVCPEPPKVVVAELNSDHVVCVYQYTGPADTTTRKVRVPRKK